MNPEGKAGGWCSRWRDSVFIRMLAELKGIFRHPQLRLWSLWWIFNSAGYYLMLYYVQILWNEIHPTRDNRRVYNGGVDAASTLLGAVTSFAAGYVKIRWSLWSELVIGSVTALQAGLLLLMNTTTNIWVCYVAYVLFRSSYQFLVPLAIFQIASSLSKELCALVFGVNTFFATVLKSIITFVIADKRGLALSVHPQCWLSCTLEHLSGLSSNTTKRRTLKQMPRTSQKQPVNKRGQLITFLTKSPKHESLFIARLG